MSDISELHTLVFNSLEEQIAVVDREGSIVDVNASWQRFGADNDLAPDYQCINTNYFKVLVTSETDDDSFAGSAKQGIADVVSGKRDSFYFEYPCHSPDEKRWFMMRVVPLRDSGNRFFVVAHQDITQRKLAEQEAERAALHDPLTGLANRRYFNRFLRREFARSIRERSSISLIEVDIDHFKDYNDDQGHPAGDKCLIQVGRVLREMAHRPTDLAVRLGGDEFALVLADTNVAGAHTVTEELLATIRKLGISNGRSGQLSLSIGVASVHPHEGQEESILLREADRALYVAKASGRDQVRFAESLADQAS
jgi:diguanylate cyclase (GGDEF)-like protein